MVNHVLELFFLIYHRLHVLRLLVGHVDHVGLVDFFLEATRVVCFGTGGEWTKCCIHDIIVVEEVLLLTLIGPAHLVKPTHIFVLHLLHLCKIGTFRRLILEVHIAEIRKIDIHLAYGSQKFGSVEGCLGLSRKWSTCWALLCSVNSTNSLVTSPFSKINTLMMGPYFENLS